MCKVCRLWGVLSLALFSCACRPNFHHKHLTLSDPLLSVCEEALISQHTCADRPKSLQLGLCMNACVNVRVYRWENFARVRAVLCLCACMNVTSNSEQHYPMVQLFSKFPFPPFLCLLTCLDFSAGWHRSVQKETTSIEEPLRGQTLFCLSSFSLSISFLCSFVSGQTK